jgi:hypothetical protein
MRFYVDQDVISMNVSGLEDNIKKAVKEIWEDMDWIYLAQYRDKLRAVVNTVMNLWEP